jgi:hypothetical protein
MEYVNFEPTAKVASAGALTLKLDGLADPPGVPALPPPPPQAAVKRVSKLTIRRLKKRFMLRSNSMVVAAGPGRPKKTAWLNSSYTTVCTLCPAKSVAAQQP